MSIIREINAYTGDAETTLAGVVDSTATYEIVDNNIIIIRTSTSDTIHITREIGKEIINLIVNNIL